MAIQKPFTELIKKFVKTGGFLLFDGGLAKNGVVPKISAQQLKSVNTNVSKNLLIDKMFGTRIYNSNGQTILGPSVYSSGGAMQFWNR